MKRRISTVLALCLALLALASIQKAYAEVPGKAENEFRYEFKMVDNKLYRLDKFTGAIELVTLPTQPPAQPVSAENGIAGNEYRYEFKIFDCKFYRLDKKTGEVVLANLPSKDKPQIEESAAPKPKGHPLPPPKDLKNSKPMIIDLNGEKVDNGVNDDPGYVPDTITDAYREHARGEIAQHSDEFGVSLTASSSGNQITGMMTVSYKGSRRILAMEISVFVPVMGDKTETVRYVLGSRRGQEAPPGPKKSRTAFFKVDQKFDTVVRGQIEHKITYVKFAEE